MNPRIIHTEYEKGTFFSHRKKEKEQFQLGFSKTYGVIMGVIACLFFYYVWVLNANATQGYTIQQLKQTQTELQVQLERLNIRIAEISSIEAISNEEVLRDMIEIGTPEYLVIRENVQYVYNY
ncbi:hypothetical protein LAT59_02455 [Candidatus Gracilibacteria bacterium]|nr:hypothetical protein [Candidatus Gracilibacteria bacterium]